MWDWIVKYWLQAAFGLIVAGLTWGYRSLSGRIKADRAAQAALKIGMKALLRDRIVQAYYYHVSKGYCKIHDRENLTTLYTAYTSLGGNGTAKDLMSKLSELPTKHKEEDHSARP